MTRLAPNTQRPILLAIIISAAAWSPAIGQITNLADFQECLTTGWNVQHTVNYGATCQLTDGTFNVGPFPESIVIRRSNIVVSGTTNSVLKRAIRKTDPTTGGPAASPPLLTAQGGLSNVTIQDLKFDGNRFALGNCGPPNIGTQEVSLSNVNSFVLSNLEFWDSLDASLGLDCDCSVSFSTFRNARATGIFLQQGASAFSNSIFDSGTAGINVYIGSGQRVIGNLLHRNRYEMSDPIEGGQLHLDDHSSNAIVAENVIDGDYWAPQGQMVNGCVSSNQYMNGVEAYGNSHSFYNNDILQNIATGMTLKGIANLMVSGFYPDCPSCNPKYVHHNGYHGIRLLPYQFTPSGPIQYNTNLRFDHVRSNNNGAIPFTPAAPFPGYSISFSGADSGMFLNDSCLIPTNPPIGLGTIENLPPGFNLPSSDSVCPQAPPLTGGLQFVPITPCRAADTRTSSGPLPSNGTRDFPIPTSPCGIPQVAAAYALNVTVVPQGPLAFLTMFPTGQNRPGVSTLNSFDGRIKANSAIVPSGDLGSVSAFATNPTDVIIDVTGYFVDPNLLYPGGLAFYSVPPCRVADTRNPAGPLGGPALTSSNGRTRNFPVTASACGIPSSAQAFALNATVVPRGPLSYLTLWPTGQNRPVVSTLNAYTGTVVANAALVKAGSGVYQGYISAFATDDTDLVLDINGYFAPAVPQSGALSFYARQPCRIADTRNQPDGPFAGPVLLGNSTRNYPIWVSPCHIPEVARAYVLNVTVVPPTPLAFLTLWPFQQSRPFVSTLNSFDGSVVSNMAIVRAADPPTPTNRTGGSISVFTTDTTQLILDTVGFFAP